MIGAPCYFLRAAFTDIRLLSRSLARRMRVFVLQTSLSTLSVVASGPAASTNKYLEIITYSHVISKRSAGRSSACASPSWGHNNDDSRGARVLEFMALCDGFCGRFFAVFSP